MNIVAILIAAAVAVSASRLPHTYNFGYYDSSPYFESPPSLPLRSSFLSSSSSKQEPSFKNSQSISVNDDILKDGSPSDFQEERNFFDFSSSTSSHLSLRKPHSFYQDGLSSYQEDQFNAQDYRGPPPPIFKEVFRKQMFPVKNESFYNSTEERIAKYPKEHTNQQPVTTEYRQSLSSAGDEHFIDNGNHGLGFASIVGVTSPNINPLDVVEITSTTKAAMELPSMKVMHTSLTNGVQTSHQTRVQQHLMATHSLNSDILPSAVTSMPLPKAARDSSYIQTSTNLESKLHDLESTTPATMKLISMVPQSNLASVQNLSNPISENTIMFPKSSKPLFDFRSRSQEFSATTHKQLPIGSLGPNVNLHHGNQNFLLYETKNNFPFQPTDFQIYKKHQNNDNIVPLRFSLPTTSTSTTLSRSTIPVNFVYQIVDFTRSPLPFITGEKPQMSYQLMLE